MRIGRASQRDLTGRVALISGGANGIGRATAAALVARGMRVAIGDLDEAALRATSAELGVLGLRLDVTSTDAWAEFVAAATAGLGAPDVLVNNAGIMPVGPILDEPERVARAMFDVNVHGVINGVKAVVPAMVQRGSGHVVNLASAVGRVPAAGGATYTASKHAVVGFSDAIRQELAPLGIDVTMILPSVTRTRLAVGVPDTATFPSQTPEGVAAVIADVVRRPVPEAWAPRWGQPLARTAGLLPRRLHDALMERTGANVLAHVDASARTDHEGRVREG